MNKAIAIILTKIGEAITAIESLDKVRSEPPDMNLPETPAGSVASAPAGGAMNMSVPPAPPVSDTTPPPSDPEAPPVSDTTPPPSDPEAPPVSDTTPPPVGRPIAPTGVTELDAEGIPWDKRIHSGAKSKLAKKNTWKLLRGVDPVLVAKVKTELAQGMGTPPDTPLPVADPLTDAPETDDGVMTWAQLMQGIAAAALDPAIVVASCMKVNVANVGILQDFPALVPIVAADLGVAE